MEQQAATQQQLGGAVPETRSSACSTAARWLSPRDGTRRSTRNSSPGVRFPGQATKNQRRQASKHSKKGTPMNGPGDDDEDESTETEGGRCRPSPDEDDPQNEDYTHRNCDDDAPCRD